MRLAAHLFLLLAVVGWIAAILWGCYASGAVRCGVAIGLIALLMGQVTTDVRAHLPKIVAALRQGWAS
jgi:hypothetical protein